MPPFIPHKRRLSPSPPTHPSSPKSGKMLKPSLFDTADNPNTTATLRDNTAFVDKFDRSESSSSLSGVSSTEFEDVVTSPKSKKRKIAHVEDHNEDEVNWEDAIRPEAPEPSGDLELTLHSEGQVGITNSLGKKKGPSKIVRQIRIATHCMHVQFLLFHNLIRNGWACDREVQSVLVGQLPANVRKEVDKWKIASGISTETSTTTPASWQKRKGRKSMQHERNQRDWGKPAERQEKGAPNMSRGDPLIRLLKVLVAYWKQRWTITAPSLRKQGYKTPATLEEDIASFKKGKHNAEEHGERVRNVEEFRDLARKCEGSRDAGAQLFTALIRGLGIEARLVASLQPVGFRWSKSEEASPMKKRSSKMADAEDNKVSAPEEESGADVELSKEKASKVSKKPIRRKRSVKGGKDAPIDLSDDSGGDKVEDIESDEDGSVIDVTPLTPRKRPSMNYDRDLVFPTFWTECISPITNEVLPVDPFVLNPAVATNAEHLTQFESKGAKADKAKQVFAYVVGYSRDGTAKDVTTRYLKRHMWPGRTKGVRLPVEKVPVYNHRGRVKRYEDYDWFKMVMSGYRRTDKMRTAVDDLEESKDLKAVKPEKKEAKAGDDTLQGYKTSAEYVLERHLRREEAIRPGSKPVKTFASGKGDKAKEEPVWLRKDVEICRTGESWHKEGRAIRAGESPMKLVPIRAVTLTRKREVEEAERESGEKLKQGLYSWNQTDWIIPPPIENGVIPKNAFGNIDCFVPTMVPKGAVHIPLRSTVRICKRLGIDYAEAVTGFEFGNKRAVPVVTGVMVAEENEKAVIDEWEKEEEERKIKEEGKREKAALATWRKWLMGLRIIERVREEYGGDADAHLKEGINPFTNQSKITKSTQKDAEYGDASNGRAMEDFDNGSVGGGFLADDDMPGGGFFPEGYEEEEIPHEKAELTIEEEEPANNAALALSPLASGGFEEASDHASASEGDKPSVTLSRESIPLANGTMAEKSEPKPKARPTDSTPRTKTLTNGKKRRAAAAPIEPDHEMPATASPRPKSRAAPKRQAARKSETAVKSHYFEKSSDSEDEENIDGISMSEDEPVQKPASRKRTTGTLHARRSLRARKNL